MLKPLFEKVADLRLATLLKKRLCEFCDVFKDTFFTEHLRATASFWNASAILRMAAEFHF